MSFGSKLKSFRHMYNITQDEIADAMGVDRSTYAYYETGRTQPTMNDAKIISKIFFIPVDHLLDNTLTLDGDPKQPPVYRFNDSFRERFPDFQGTTVTYDDETFELTPFEKEVLVKLRLAEAIQEQRELLMQKTTTRLDSDTHFDDPLATNRGSSIGQNHKSYKGIPLEAYLAPRTAIKEPSSKMSAEEFIRYIYENENKQ